MFVPPPTYHVETPFVHTSIIHQIHECLSTCYHMDTQSSSVLVLKLLPLIENPEQHSVIHDFIKKSHSLNLPFSQESTKDNLPSDDAILQAPQWHEVLFESPHLRVLWGTSLPGDHEPFHTHHWNSLMVIIQQGTFEIENSDGSLERDLWPEGVYELPAETSPSAYTNIGASEFRALRFEFKNT